MAAVNILPTETEFVQLARRGNLVPVHADLMADFETPVSVYAKLSERRPAFMLESVEGGEHIGRYSFVGCQPRKTITAYAEKSRIVDRDGRVTELPTPQDPLTLVENEMAQYKPVTLPGMPPFLGGAVGFLGYEYISRIEPTVPPAARDELGMPILYYMIIDALVAFDHAKQILRLCVNAHIGDGEDPRQAYGRAVADLRALYGLLRAGTQPAPMPVAAETAVTVPPGNFTKPSFEGMVEASKEYIRSGDIIQVVLSQRLEREYGRAPLDLYRALRVVNPSPYMFILDSGDFAAVGASPEVHVRLTGDLVETRPIAGTRPRGNTPAEDLFNEKDLLADEKERAEHLMLVDLARNDVGRVCRPGTVLVKEFAVIERYSHVMHIVSQVEGRLDPSRNAYDLMRATFPAGTVSGAPKIRAMQIISQNEGAQRGVYAGALGYFSYDGNCDSCIAIRTALLKGGRIYVQSGAGIVADSVPANEYQETLNKAKGMLKAVALSERIGDAAP